MPASSDSIAVIGAGLAGVACARELMERGLRVTLIEKSRGPGGRTSTRREGARRFDHGAARLELGAPELAERRAEWEAAGVIAPWTPRTRGGSAHGATWIGVPGASALCAHLARGLDVRTGHRVTALVATGERWRLALDGGEVLGPFDAVAITAPVAQTRALLASTAITAHDARLDEAELAPCLAAMVVVAPRGGAELDEIHVADGPLAQAHRMDQRPGRTAEAGAQAWVLHGREAWSAKHIEDDPEVSARVLADELARELPGEILEVRGHRWRYARATRRIARPYLFDRARRIGLAGDWFEAGTHAPAASRALLSGLALAEALHVIG